MSKTATLRSGNCFWSCDVADFIFLLKSFETVLILDTHPFSWNPNRVLAKGRHPSGGREVTPILLAPNPCKSCWKPLTDIILVSSKVSLQIPAYSAILS